MAHHRIKNIALDEDDLDYSDGDDYYGDDGVVEGGDELSAEDQEQMRSGTISVRQALGEQYEGFIIDAQIHEALWHYYYDVGKSVTYLKNQATTPQQAQPTKQQKPKQISKFDQAAAASAAQAPVVSAKSKNDRDSPAQPWDFFKNVPWHNVPEERKGTIVTEALQPPLRLLGGAPSKLAALAAARRKKEAEQKANSQATEQEGSAGLSLMDRLGTKPTRPLPPQPLQSSSNQPTQDENASPAASRSYPIRKRKSPSPPPPVAERRPTPSEATIPPLKPAGPRASDIRASPSIFAQAMCGGGAPRPSVHSESLLFSEKIAPSLLDHRPTLADTNPFAGPSPDDVVMQAQAKASASKKQSGQKKDSKSVSGVTNGVSEMSIDDALQPKVKSKHLDVLAEYERSDRKNAASFVVIGHVDHGKSTLMGRLLYDLKVVDQRSIDKLRKEATNIGKSSFALAWVMDATSEERERGVTVDIASNNFETDKTKFTILDAPGHRDFIPNMIAGASQADFAVLVIDAGTNSFEAGLKGQTREHAQLVRSMGCQRVIVAVNKMDSVQWSRDRFEEIQQQIAAFLEKTGFQAKNIAFIPCSGLTGENVVLPAPEAASWYTTSKDTQTLVAALESFQPTKAALDSPLRLPISDVFRGGITNPLSISGKIEAGTLQVGDQILAMPVSETATIKGIEIDGQPAEWAVAGQIITLHLNDIDPIHLRVADVLCDPRKPIRNIKSFTTKLLAFEHVLPMQVDIHRGRLHVPGRITQLLGVLDKSSGEVQKKKPRVVQPGAIARVKVELDAAVPLEVPSRIVLRANGATVAAGLLEQVHA
ncbi:hypothetical protein AAFC00_004258 [Neodothiora populina]|uniref:Elongation factor 1-alpha n=1 Tax=Neodothiora populina TaxID=2781224 RepID=A0ABR3PJ34_9PEZI